MKRPILNLDELEMKSIEDGPFAQRYGEISNRIGAKKLGYNLTIVPPGKKSCPFHNHRVDEEMFFILEGEGLLRFGPDEYPLRAFDIIACPPGGREVAHQIVNTGAADLKYLALSSESGYEICEYPDSDKVGVYSSAPGSEKFRGLFRASQAVEYMDGERK